MIKTPSGYLATCSCNRCSREADSHYTTRTAFAARLKSEGWIVRDNGVMDVCPLCAKDRKPVQETRLWIVSNSKDLHGWYYGKTPESIIKRLFGNSKDLCIIKSNDANAPELYTIGRYDFKQGATQVLGKIIHIEIDGRDCPEWDPLYFEIKAVSRND